VLKGSAQQHAWRLPGSAAWPTAALTLAVCPFSEYDDLFIKLANY